MSYADLLGKLAAAHGIEPHYTDAWGKVHQTAEEVARALLQSLGISTESEAAIERELAEDSARAWTQPVDPTLVIRQDADSIRLRIPALQQGDSIKLEIQWESGDRVEPEIQHHWYFLPELATTESTEIGGVRYLAKRLPLPDSLRLGYHRIRLYRMKNPELEVFAEAQLIVCPPRALAVSRPMAGLAISLYGLRSERNWGCGDFTDLRTLIDAFAPAGAAFIALNPLHAIANRTPYNTSPYLPQCAFYRNFLYLDVERVGDPRLTADELQEIAALRESEFVEYERVARLKLAVLSRIFDRFPGSPDFDRYIAAEGGLLEDYAIYCVLDEEMHRRDPNVWLWTQWPEEYHDPRSEAVGAFAQAYAHRVRFFQFLQWQISLQAAAAQAHAVHRGMEIGLYHDLAMATDQFGADLWALRPFFASGCRVGAPPDIFAPGGQDWGFPPPDRNAHRRNGYRLFAQSIRKAAEAGGALRMDHVMRFFRLYSMPDGMDAKHGAYMRNYPDDLMGILALESVRGGFVVIGEDLGTVQGDVRHALAENGILSYKVIWFERNQDGSFRLPPEYPAEAIATTTTHDLPTLPGFPLGRDIEARKEAGLIDPEAYQAQWTARREDLRQLEQALKAAGFDDDPIGFLLSTPCALAVINQEDLSGETNQQNLPGSTWQYPNWRRKMLVPLEAVGPLAKTFTEGVRKSKR